MKPENKQFLDDNYRHYDTLVKAGFMSLDAHIKQRMLDVMREEFEASYHTSLWCSTCVVDMVKLLYRRYDEWHEIHRVSVTKEVSEFREWQKDINK